MAERARSLRKNLSKSKAASKPISNNSSQPSSTVQDVDPLQYLEKNNNDSTMKEELEKLKILKELESITNTNQSQSTLRHSMNSIKEPEIKNLIDRMKKNKEEHKNPMKIFSKEEEKNDDRPIPGKLGPPELSKEKKNQMMERMISARQNLQKNGLSQDIIKRTSQAILNKARNLEDTLNKNIPTVFNGDSDVKQTHLRVNSDYNVFNIINKSVLRECGSFLNLQTIEQGKKALTDMMMSKPLKQTTKPSLKKFEA